MTPDPVQVWVIRTDLPRPVIAALEPLLDEGERSRAAAIRQDRVRDRFITAHGASRCILADRLGTAPAALRWRRGLHGKPELIGDRPGVHANLSHSGDLALLAISEQRPVGVDIQRLTPQLDAARMAARFFPEPEARAVASAGADQLDHFVALWVRKEACVKALGERLMRCIHLPVAGDGGDRGQAAGVLVRDPRGTVDGPLRVRDLPAPAGFRAAVALTGPAPFTLAVRQWSAPAWAATARAVPAT